MEDNKFCIRCGSFNVEEIARGKSLCSNCDLIFTNEDYRMAYKIANKKLSLETGEQSLRDLVDGSMNYIFKKGVLLGPNIENELRMHIGHIPDEVILSRLSYLECTSEDISQA